MKFPLCLLVGCTGFLSSVAQSPWSVKGTVTDTTSDDFLENATVSILNAKDSILYNFTRAAKDGSFSVSQVRPGNYLLLVTYPGYADYVEKFTIDSLSKARDFNRINMILKSKLLENVIVTGTKAAIKIKGDTTEYNASSYTIQPNSKVEDLLKQLPGIQIDKDGQITAQGQTVNKVLVDGEEFFGDDPTLVTRNIRGDMVDKVQLYDKKSDQAAFTGIDDGERNKTINIKLKEDKKNGYFGKLEAGIGSGGFYQEQLMYNKFKGKKKFSVYGTFANTGKSGLDWGDNAKYGAGGGEVEIMEGGGIVVSARDGDEFDSFDGRYSGSGIPIANTGGVHYDNKWDEDKKSINTNYKIGSLAIEGVGNTFTLNNLPTGAVKTNTDKIFNNSIFRQKLDAAYLIKLDSSSDLKITVGATAKKTKNDTYNSSSTYDGNDALLNYNTNSLTNEGDQKLINASALYTKKFKKTGRTLSVNVSEEMNQDDSKGFLNSETNFYDKGELDSVQFIDQFKTRKTLSNNFSSNVTYSEAFSKTLSLLLNYGLRINTSSADRKSFNATDPGKYNSLDSSLSNNYEFNQLSNQAGAIFNYRKDKSTFTFGTRMFHVRFKQHDLYRNELLYRNFINWSPQATYMYKYSSQGSVRITYNGSTSQPNISQIQPVRENTNPLNIYIGNPDLRPSFINRFNAEYNSYKVLSGRFISVGGGYSFTSNPIVSSSITDSAGKTINQTINLNNKMPSDFYLRTFSNQEIKSLKMSVGLNAGIQSNTSYNYSNNSLNTAKSTSYNGQLRFSKHKESKYNTTISFGPNYNVNTSSLQKHLSNKGWGFNTTGSFNFYLPAGIEIGGDGNYEYRAKTETFNRDFKRFILNARVSKSFFEDKALKVSISGNDLLNQNTGFNRSAYNGYFTQSTNTTIKRFFMFSIIYDFNKMGGNSSK